MSHSLFKTLFFSFIIAGCASGSKFPRQAEFDPAILGNLNQVPTSTDAQTTASDLIRGADYIHGIDIESVEIAPEVPLLIELQALRQLEGSKDYLAQSDITSAYSDLNLAYAEGKSCFNVTIKSKNETQLTDSDLLAYLEDSNHNLYRLAVSGSGNRNTQQYVPGYTSTTSSIEYNPLTGKNQTVYHDNQVSGYMATLKLYSAVFCSSTKIDFSKPFNFYLSSKTIRTEWGVTTFSWFPTGSQPLSSNIVPAIQENMTLHPDFQLELSKFGQKEMDYFLTALNVADYQLILSAINVGISDETLGDRKNLGLLTMIDAKRGRGCSSDFISKMVLKGALLDDRFFKIAQHPEMDRCTELDLIRFIQIPAHREAAFIRVTNELGEWVKNTFQFIRLPLTPEKKLEIQTIVSVEKGMLTFLKHQCSVDHGKTCILYSRGHNDMDTIRSALKQEDGKRFPAKVRENLSFLTKLFSDANL